MSSDRKKEVTRKEEVRLSIEVAWKFFLIGCPEEGDSRGESEQHMRYKANEGQAVDACGSKRRRRT